MPTYLLPWKWTTERIHRNQTRVIHLSNEVNMVPNLPNRGFVLLRYAAFSVIPFFFFSSSMITMISMTLGCIWFRSELKKLIAAGLSCSLHAGWEVCGSVQFSDLFYRFVWPQGFLPYCKGTNLICIAHSRNWKWNGITYKNHELLKRPKLYQSLVCNITCHRL